MAKDNKNNLKTKKKRVKVKDPHETLTLKYWLIGAIVIAAVVGLTVLAVTFLSRMNPQEFTYENGVLTRVSDGRIYLKADEPFEVLFPVAMDTKDTPYGECEEFKVYKVGYYNKYGILKSMDVDNYLTDGIYFYFSYYVAIPKLEDFKTDTVRIGEMSADEKSRLYLVSFTKEDATAFIDEYRAGNRYKGDAKGVRTYCVQLTSAEYSYLSYMLYAVECEDGSWYMYSKTDRSSIAMDAKWFETLKAKVESTTSSPTTVDTPTAS